MLTTSFTIYRVQDHMYPVRNVCSSKQEAKYITLISVSGIYQGILRKDPPESKLGKICRHNWENWEIF